MSINKLGQRPVNLESFTKRLEKQSKEQDTGILKSEELCKFLMGKVDYLPAEFDGPAIHLSREMRSMLHDLLRTHRFGFIGTNEDPEKTIAKLEKLSRFVQDTLKADQATDESSAIAQFKTHQNENLQPVAAKYKQYSAEQINAWLFEQDKSSVAELPPSKLKGRDAAAYQSKTQFDSVAMAGKGKISSHIGIYNGGITDLRTNPGQTAAVGDSNNGDLLTGCGFAVAKAVVNATGPGLQAELYNKYGAPQVMETTDYGKKNYSQFEGRGYAITCDAYDMKSSHGIQSVELLTVPMNSEEGVINMYLEALIHSSEKNFIALPMAGMTHPVLNDDSKKSARLATEAVKQFFEKFPDSPLKIIFVIWKNPAAETQYSEAIRGLD